MRDLGDEQPTNGVHLPHLLVFKPLVLGSVENFQTVSLGTWVNWSARAALSAKWHHCCAMPQYMVTMHINKADPLLPIAQLVGVVREAVLPSVERLMALKAQGKVVTGG